MATGPNITSSFSFFSDAIDLATILDEDNGSKILGSSGISRENLDIYHQMRAERLWAHNGPKGATHGRSIGNLNRPPVFIDGIEGAKNPLDVGAFILAPDRKPPPAQRITWDLLGPDGRVRDDLLAEGEDALPPAADDMYTDPIDILRPLVPSSLSVKELSFLPAWLRADFINLMRQVKTGLTMLTVEKFEAPPDVIIGLQKQAQKVLEAYLAFDEVFRISDIEATLAAEPVALLQNYIEGTVVPLVQRLTWYLAVFFDEEDSERSRLGAAVTGLEHQIYHALRSFPVPHRFDMSSSLSVILLARVKPTLRFLNPEVDLARIESPVWRDFLVLRKTCDALVIAAKLDYVLWPDQTEILPLSDAEIAETWENCALTTRALRAYLQTVKDHPKDEMERMLRRCLHDVFSDLSFSLSRAILWAAYFQDNEDDDEWRNIFAEAIYNLRALVSALRAQDVAIPGVNLTQWYKNIETGLDFVQTQIVSRLEDRYTENDDDVS